LEFKEAVEIILKHEGGYVNDPNDPGGETKYGISKRAYPKINIKRLTKKDAREIYKKHYWNKIKADKLPPEIRLAMFDFAVNSGVYRAISLIQKIVKAKRDGVLGPKTLRKISLNNPAKITERFLKERTYFYFRNKNFSIYGKGWMKRLVDIAHRSSYPSEIC